MALTPAFTVSQGIDAHNFTITDTSTGSDTDIATREIFVELSDGTFIVPPNVSTDYVPFPLSDGNSVEVDNILPIDYAVSITIKWVDINGNVLYELSQSYCFEANDEQFMYSLVQFISANPSVLQNTKYIMNCFSLSMFVDYAVKSVEVGNDITGAQNLLNLAQNLISNEQYYFGGY